MVNISETRSSSKFSRNAGVIYNIVSLQSDITVNEFIAQIISYVSYAIRKVPDSQSKIYIDAVGCEGPEISLRNIQNKVSKVVEPDNKWQYQNLLEQAKATCFSPHRDFYPDYKKGATKVAEHFQVSIDK